MSRRVDSDCHNNSLRVEPELRATKQPAKSNKPRGLAIDFYQTTATGFSRPPSPFPPPSSGVSISAASGTPRCPPHPAAPLLLPAAAGSAEASSRPVCCRGNLIY
ncbi:unnamed protein product [Musa acuminata subsp. burmannicoides]